MRSIIISKCNSPIPLKIVWPVSSSVRTRKVGSSSTNLAIAIPILSTSACVLGSIAIDITGSGKVILSNTIGLSSLHNVSPVFISLNPTAAPISPASIKSTGFCLLACICIILLIRSFLPVRVFNT